MGLLNALSPLTGLSLDEQRMLSGYKNFIGGSQLPPNEPAPILNPAENTINNVANMINQGGTVQERMAGYKDKLFQPMDTNALTSATVQPIQNQYTQAPQGTYNVPDAKTGGILPGGADIPASAQGNSILENAYQFKGAPYVWGGTSPKGFDCSGFTQYVARMSGVNIPRSASQQYSYFKNNGRLFNDISQASPGDMLYFESSASPSGWHTGIYIGGGKMINAAGRKSGVIVQSIGNRRLRGIGRM